MDTVQRSDSCVNQIQYFGSPKQKLFPLKMPFFPITKLLLGELTVSICTSDKKSFPSIFLSLLQIHMKTPEFGKVLEQKLSGTVDLVGFELSPDYFEQF